jgi:hypothetical protein
MANYPFKSARDALLRASEKAKSSHPEIDTPLSREDIALLLQHMRPPCKLHGLCSGELEDVPPATRAFYLPETGHTWYFCDECDFDDEHFEDHREELEVCYGKWPPAFLVTDLPWADAIRRAQKALDPEGWFEKQRQAYLKNQQYLESMKDWPETTDLQVSVRQAFLSLAHALKPWLPQASYCPATTHVLDDYETWRDLGLAQEVVEVESRILFLTSKDNKVGVTLTPIHILRKGRFSAILTFNMFPSAGSKSEMNLSWRQQIVVRRTDSQAIIAELQGSRWKGTPLAELLRKDLAQCLSETEPSTVAPD